MSVYDKEAYAERVSYLCQCFLRGTDSRHRDTCVEMADGDAVVVAVYRRALKRPELYQAIAWSYGGTFPQSWIDLADKHSQVKNLAQLAREERAAWEQRYGR